MISSDQPMNGTTQRGQTLGAGGKVRGLPPRSLTKYRSTTEHEEGQVIDPMHLSP